MRVLNVITLLLVIVGGMNRSSAAARVIYVLVALSALYQVSTLVRMSTTDRELAYPGR
jgi:uncharacterized membrane protein YuzA (DUF378 family)